MAGAPVSVRVEVRLTEGGWRADLVAGEGRHDAGPDPADDAPEHLGELPVTGPLPGMSADTHWLTSAQHMAPLTVRLDGYEVLPAGQLPELMGAKAFAELLGVKVPNLWKIDGLPEPAQRVSGVPVWAAATAREFARAYRERS